MIRAIPVINTARLTLRGMRHGDFDRFVEIWADADVVRYISGKPRSRDESWGVFLRIAGHWQMTGFGQWAIVDQSSRKMVGQTGFFMGARGLGEDFDSYPEAGWVLAPEAHGQGQGAEAAEAAHEWFDRVIPGPLVAIVDNANSASQKMAERLGYSLMRKADYNGTEVQLLRRDGPCCAG